MLSAVLGQLLGLGAGATERAQQAPDRDLVQPHEVLERGGRMAGLRTRGVDAQCVHGGIFPAMGWGYARFRRPTANAAVAAFHSIEAGGSSHAQRRQLAFEHRQHLRREEHEARQRDGRPTGEFVAHRA